MSAFFTGAFPLTAYGLRGLKERQPLREGKQRGNTNPAPRGPKPAKAPPAQKIKR